MSSSSKNTILDRIEMAIVEGATKLDLSHKKLSEVPPEVAQLTQLQTLDLQGNQLSALPPEIRQLTQLRELSLHNNHLTTLPPEIRQLTQLRELGLHGNELATLPPEIGQLTQLETLFLGDNQLSRLLPEIGQLVQLESLYLHDNQLATLPPEVAQLTLLKHLVLSRNQLAKFPLEITRLTHLSRIDLDENRLSELPPEIAKLTQLKTLDLQDNQLSALPAEIQRLSQLTRLLLHGNDQLGIPAETLGPDPRQGYAPEEKATPPTEILAYYFRNLAEESRPLLEAKLLLVGQGTVGKTSLKNRLLRNQFNKEEEQTDGIDIERWEVEVHDGEQPQTVRLNIWDFGGQEILHATHQFFLTHRSLYLLVLDARKGQHESRLHYWMQIIQSFGGDSPVLLVVNKCDGNHIPSLNRVGLLKQYAPNLRKIFFVSCETGKGLAELKKAIRHTIADMDHIYDPVPVSYFRVKEAVEKRTDEDDILDLEDYEGLCEENSLVETSEQRGLLRFLHDLGNVLHYGGSESPYDLEQTGVLNPEWVTDSVYRIIHDPTLKGKGGVLEAGDLERLLPEGKGYDQRRRKFILGMLLKFELGFEFPEEKGKFLVAGLLDENEQEPEFEDDDPLRFLFEYEALPPGLLPRFIVRSRAHLTEPPQYWLTGTLLEIDGNPALVRGNPQTGLVEILVHGHPSRRRAALTAIRQQFAHIHSGIKRLKVLQKVPLPDQPDLFVDYDHLLELEDLGERTLVPKGAGKSYRIRELLDGIEEPAEREARRPGPRYQAETMVFTESATLGDHNEQHGIGMAGRDARLEGNTIQQAYTEGLKELGDLKDLATSLGELLQKLPLEAKHAGHFEAMAEIAKAKEASEEGHGNKVLKHLKQAGSWTLDTATKIGVKAAAEAIKTAMGLP